MDMKVVVTLVTVAFVVCIFPDGNNAQQAGTQQSNAHPPINIGVCSPSGCKSEKGSIVLDSNWRWTHKDGTYTNCYTGDKWDEGLCPDPVTCASNCALDGADYEKTYGVIVEGDSVQLNFVTPGQYDTNIGSRNYLMQDDSTYRMFKLKNQEFTFDVDVSNLPCGLNGALYFVQMDADGGLSKYPGNKAGAAYGTGYCDAQCPHDLKFINGEANILDWTPSPTDPNSGTGRYGTCCTEMDIWEANSMAQAVTPHVCSVNGQTRCNGTACGDDSKGEREDGVCDKDGGDFNPYRLGDTTFFGVGSNFKVDSSKPFTVVTQFITSDNTTAGDLVEIRRLYVQDGNVVPVEPVNVDGKSFDSVTDSFVNAQKTAFNDTNAFEKRGGLKAMGKNLENGMVLVLSLWDDFEANMLWLDSSYPLDKPASDPGVTRGPCATSSGVPKDVQEKYPNAHVKFSNIKIGDIGSTYGN